MPQIPDTAVKDQPALPLVVDAPRNDKNIMVQALPNKEDDLAAEYMARQRDREINDVISRARREQGLEDPQADSALKGDAGIAPTKAIESDDAPFFEFAGPIEVGEKVILGGMRDAGQEFLEFVDSAAIEVDAFAKDYGVDVSSIDNAMQDFLGIARIDLPEVDQPESVVGRASRGVVQFITGFLAGNKLFAVAGLPAGLARAAAAGAVSDAFFFDPNEPGLANLIQEVPELKNPITELLAAEPDDSEAEGRFKHAVEGMLGGALTEGLLRVLRVGIKGGTPKVIGETPEEILASTIQDTPELKNLIDEILAAAPDDAEALARFREASKELIGGQQTDVLIRTLRDNVGKKQTIDETAEELKGSGFLQFGAAKRPLVEIASDEKAEGFLRVETTGEAFNINLARLNTTDDVKEVIERTAKTFTGEIDEARRGTIALNETAALADDLGMTPADLLSRRKGQAFNAEQALAARRILVASAENLTELAKAASGVNAGDVDLAAFRRALSVHAALQQQVSGLTAEAGRALSAFRIPAGGGEIRIKAIRDMIEMSGGTNINRDMARMVAGLDDPQKLNTFARQAEKATTGDMVLEAWINGLLSNPATHAVNTMSNTMVAFWQIPERLLAAGIGRLTGEGGVAVGEAAAQTFGFVQGMKDGFILASKALAKGEPSDVMAKIEARRFRAITGENFAQTLPGKVTNVITMGSLERGGIAARAVDFMGEAVRIPGRFLMAEDEFFKSIGYRMELNARAYRQAAEEGLQGRGFAQRVRQIIDDPPDDIKLASIDASRYQTFTRPLGPGGRAVQAGISAQPWMRLIIPFMRTPTNIMKFVGERTPLAPLSKTIRQEIAAGGARREMALARISMGTAVMAVSMELAASGQITGGGPTNHSMRSTLRRTGWQPYSIKVGDTYYAYNRLDPLGGTIGIAADISEIMGQVGQEDADALAAAGVMAVANNIVSKTYMQGVSNLVEVFASVSPEAGASQGERFIRRFAGSIIPAGVAQAERLTDPTLRAVDSVIGQIRSRVPGWSADLPPRRNLWGEPIVLQGGLGPDVASPIYTSKAVDSPVDEELIRLQLPISMPTRTVGGIELSLMEYDRYVLLAGKEVVDPSSGFNLKDALESLIESPEYDDLTDGPEGGKSFAIRRVVQAFRAGARALLQEEFPELRDAIVREKLKLVQ